MFPSFSTVVSRLLGICFVQEERRSCKNSTVNTAMVSISPLEAQQANSHSRSPSSCLISQHDVTLLKASKPRCSCDWQVQAFHLWDLDGGGGGGGGEGGVRRLIKQKPIWVISLASPWGVGGGILYWQHNWVRLWGSATVRHWIHFFPF